MLFFKNGQKCTTITVPKMKCFIKDFFSKCDQIGSFLRIWSHVLKKSLMENSFYAVYNTHERSIVCSESVMSSLCWSLIFVLILSWWSLISEKLFLSVSNDWDTSVDVDSRLFWMIGRKVIDDTVTVDQILLLSSIFASIYLSFKTSTRS